MKTQICTLHQLNICRENRWSVVVPKSRAWKKPRPAAWMINLPGHVLLTLFEIGMYVYEPKARKKNVD